MVLVALLIVMMLMHIVSMNWMLNHLRAICRANQIKTKCKRKIGKQFQLVAVHFLFFLSPLSFPLLMIFVIHLIDVLELDNCFSLFSSYFSTLFMLFYHFNKLPTLFSFVYIMRTCVWVDRHWNKIGKYLLLLEF